MRSTFIDQMGRSLELDFPPRRIVSLVPSQTELLFDLGLGERVVGVTDYCTEPAAMPSHVERIGGTKRFRFDRIEALAPDLVIGNREENYREGIERLAARFPVWMSDILTLDDALAMIRAIGALCDRAETADAMAAAIATGFDGLRPPRRRRVAYFIWKKPWMVAGGGNFIDDVLARCGFVNVFADRARYPEVTLEDLAAHDPDCVLLSSEPFPFAAEHLEELRALLPRAAVQIVDAMPFSWYGSRLLRAPAELQKILEYC